MASCFSSKEDITICHVNAQSLLAHFDQFKMIFQRAEYHVICVSETWLKSTVADSFVEVPGYELFRCDRIGKGGRGVAVYVLKDIKAKILVTSGNIYCKRPEYIIMELSPDNVSKFLLATVYRPPHSGYLAEFEDCFIRLQVGYVN